MKGDSKTAIRNIAHIPIPVRDGCQLSARVWMPQDAQENPKPAILEILPYRKRDGTNARDETTHALFARQDYVCLRVDLRGCGESEGLFDDEYSEQELSDIEDVIAWIADQSWCTGAVGIMGISWGGFNGLQVAARRPPALKAVISLCSSVDRFADDIHYKGGCHLTENLGWAATVMSWFSLPPDPLLAGEDWRKTWLRRLENTPFLASRWIRHRQRDAYWKHGSVCEDFSAIEAAVLVIGGWHDGYRNTPLKLLEAGTSGPVKAVMGPWNHKYPHIATPGPRVDFVQEALRWWDQWLQGKDTGVADDPDYRVFVVDGIEPCRRYETRPGRWIGLDQWPDPRIDAVAYHLGPQGLGTTPLDAPLSVASDPRCGEGCGQFFPVGFGANELPDDQAGDDARSLCFETSALEKDMSIVGAPVVALRLSSDQEFGQVIVRLCDVAPDGQSTLISFGMLDLQFREGFDKAKPLTPGALFDVELTLDQAGYTVAAGHQLRLAISASYWPFIWPSAGPVTLQLASGSLSVPRLEPVEPMPPSFHFDPDVPAAPMRELRAESQRVERYEQDGEIVQEIDSDYGESEDTDHGLRQSSRLHERWSIDANDISKARADIRWERGMGRGDFQISTRLNATMHTDADYYYIAMRLEAFEGEHCVFARDFHDSIRRDPTKNQEI